MCTHRYGLLHAPPIAAFNMVIVPEGSRVITVDKQLVSDDASGGGAGFAFDELASFTLKNYNTHSSSAWVYAFRRTGGAAEGGRNLS